MILFQHMEVNQLPSRKKLILKGQESQAIKELLEGDYWLPTLTGKNVFSVQTDDIDGDPTVDWLTVYIAPDSDVHVHIIQGSSCRFRMPMIGGGRHKRVRNALLILAEAIRSEAEERIEGTAVT